MIEFYTATQRKARKAHLCSVCGGVIMPGSEYMTSQSEQNGRYRYIKTHIHCDACLNAYTNTGAGCGEWDEMIDSMIEWMGEEACSRCPNRDTCRMQGCELFSCDRVLKRVLPPTVLHAALRTASSEERDAR